jgi:hypothetical protein
MRVYKQSMGDTKAICNRAIILERKGFVYNKDFTVRDASWSMFLDNRKCADIFFANKRTQEAYYEIANAEKEKV